MPSTIVWLAVAITTGSLLGLLVGQWKAVAGWLHRCLEDPVGRPLAPTRANSVDEVVGNTDSDHRTGNPATRSSRPS